MIGHELKNSDENFNIVTIAQTTPCVCPNHPNSRVRHFWDETHAVLNGYPAGLGTKSNHRYECAECGLQLSDNNPRELLACPFCGHAPIILRLENSLKVQIACNNGLCGVRPKTDLCATDWQAIASWNVREK
jgi:DNA-directed RNA polymerase subunit RPC12/RpoP